MTGVPPPTGSAPSFVPVGVTADPWGPVGLSSVISRWFSSHCISWTWECASRPLLQGAGDSGAPTSLQSASTPCHACEGRRRCSEGSRDAVGAASAVASAGSPQPHQRPHQLPRMSPAKEAPRAEPGSRPAALPGTAWQPSLAWRAGRRPAAALPPSPPSPFSVGPALWPRSCWPLRLLLQSCPLPTGLACCCHLPLVLN